MRIKDNKCLLLNSDYSPLSIISWKRAVIWSMRYVDNPKYGIEIIDFFKNDFINGVNNKKYPIPAVAKTKKFFKIINQNITFSRKNIFIRDNHTCQYCSCKFDAKYLTYDHVIPKSKWVDTNRSPTNWTNIVTACIDCNRKKGNRTPKQANMPLVSFPKEPNKNKRFLPIFCHLTKIKEDIPDEWRLYIPQSYYL
jgi:hypothetical protein